MAPIGPLLWRNLRIYKIYGANTDVGKTIVSSILCNASRRIWKNEATAYLKPVSTGPENEADDNHVKKFTKDVAQRTLYQYGLAVSPHIAARGHVISDASLLKSIYDFASERASSGPGWLFLETAGGIHSPGPSGTTQADLYTPLRCPVLLVGDWKLGGISSTISAFESLKMRGYDVESIVVFNDSQYGNFEYLKDYFGRRHGLAVTALSMPPPRSDARSEAEDEKSLLQYYRQESQTKGVRDILTHLHDRHQARVQDLEAMPVEAHKKMWYPFTQHKLLQPRDVLAIDSANGSYFQTLVPNSAAATNETALLQPSFDGSASWWTQGLGHGNSSLTLAAAYASGRYGHVMFAGTVHEPALKLAKMLLSSFKNPRLSRVFFSDNGSTGVEVAVKMALRAARIRYGRSSDAKIDILGLRGSYHGDTIGTMDCAEPNTYNEKVEWYEGKGAWLDYPQIRCVAGQWQVQVPSEMGSAHTENFSHISEIFHLERRIARGEHKLYEAYILSTIKKSLDQGRKFGALILEPLVLGAGGMVLVDPLFQHTLVQVVRQNSSIFGPELMPGHPGDDSVWKGLPVVFDEVFTGIYRLGRLTAASFLDVQPDISVHAKILTGGLIPLCVTLASEGILDAFASNEKSDALLHGHSYTAHPIGCQVAVESLNQLQSIEKSGGWDWAKANGWVQADNGTNASDTASGPQVWSIWPASLVRWLSLQSESIAGAWAVGSVLAIHLHASDGSGYGSAAAEGLRKRLLVGAGKTSGASWNVHSRVLGNVLYLMGNQLSTESEVAEISELLRQAIGE
ncbi:bifunctional dethiobiotin synthetase/adenosylmethionine-8-amino-7-oxononanoate aminotransferase [Nemania sp. FL0916]|nr:bifunctional dethiobiotin synthetase/adenosylmethionine-8-amino-7-oxononanoate aminotransferase [Nemania sp. FL0916]